MKSEYKIWLVALGFVALYGGLVVWAYPLFSPDVACRYAPMADEFARGNWELAFHPRFDVFFQCVSGLIAKSHVPFGRRFAFVQASEWAVEKIRADYRGPRQDDKNAFSIREYHRPNRPVVHGHNPRIGYLLGGRDESQMVFGAADCPDYWVTGHHDEEFVRDEYELMDTFICGKRRFDLYKHKEERGL